MKRPFATSLITVGSLNLFALGALAQGDSIPGVPPTAGPTFGPISQLEGGGLNRGLPNPAVPPTLKTDVTVPELYVNGTFYQKARVVSQDGKGKVVFTTSTGQVDCLFFEIDPIALNLLRVKSPQEEELEKLQQSHRMTPANVIPTSVPSGSDTNPNKWGINNDLLKDEELAHRWGGPGGTKTIEGIWLFNSEIWLNFQGSHIGGEVFNAEGLAIGAYKTAWSAAEMRMSANAYDITFENEDLAPIHVEMRDHNFLVGQDLLGNPFRARRPGYIPYEYQDDRLDKTITEKTPEEVAMVELDFLRLVRCYNHPWTSDVEQGPDCAAPPQEEIEHRLKSFHGGSNPVIKGLLAEIPTHVKAIEDMRMVKKIKMENLEMMASVMFQRTVTRTNTNSFSGVSSTTTEVEVDHEGRNQFLRKAEEEWDAKIRDLNTLLDCEYQNIAMQLGETAPQMYQTKLVLPKLVEVKVSDGMLIVENVSGYPLSNLTIKMEVVHAESGDSPDDFRLFYSPCLHMGQKRYSSAAWLMKEEPGDTIPDETRETQLSPADIRSFKITAWAREARQNEEIVAVVPERAANGSVGPANMLSTGARVLQWTNKAGKNVLAEFVRMEGSSVVIKRDTGEIFTIPLSDLDEASQAQAGECAAGGQ